MLRPKSGETAKGVANFRKKREVRRRGGGERTILQKTRLRLMEVIHFRTNCFSTGVKSKSKFHLTRHTIYRIILLRCQIYIGLYTFSVPDFWFSLFLGLFSFRFFCCMLFLWLFCTYYRLRYQSVCAVSYAVVCGSCQPIDQKVVWSNNAVWSVSFRLIGSTLFDLVKWRKLSAQRKENLQRVRKGIEGWDLSVLAIRSVEILWERFEIERF